MRSAALKVAVCYILQAGGVVERGGGGMVPPIKREIFLESAQNLDF